MEKREIAPTIPNCGTVTDSRDGTVYDTVQIGTQCWMRENMNIGTRIPSSTAQSKNSPIEIIEKYCYNNQDANCANPHPTYPDGGLYTWNEAMQYSTTEGAQGICPDGWHIPTDAEQYTLEDYLKDVGQSCDSGRPDTTGDSAGCYPAAVKMRPGGSSGFEMNISGFSATGGASWYRDIESGFWSSTPYLSDLSHPIYRAIMSSTAGFGFGDAVARGGVPFLTQALPVRCVQGAGAVSSPPPPTACAETWVSRPDAADNSWYSVAYGNGTFVAVSNDGANRVMTSSDDGVTWTGQNVPLSGWQSVTYGGGLFVANSSDMLMTSPDGINWELRIVPSLGAGGDWSEVSYGNGIFVGVGSDASANRRAMTSSDGGLTWNIHNMPNRTSGLGLTRSITFGEGLFVALTQSDIMTSSDGVNWNLYDIPDSVFWGGITYGNDIFVAAAISSPGNDIITSPDGTNWTIQSGIPGYMSSGHIAYGGGLFVLPVFIPFPTNHDVAVSTDGVTWTYHDTPANNSWWDIAYGNGTFVGVAPLGTDRVMTSDCGAVTSPPDILQLCREGVPIAQGGGSYGFTLATGGTTGIRAYYDSDVSSGHECDALSTDVTTSATFTETNPTGGALSLSGNGTNPRIFTGAFAGTETVTVTHSGQTATLDATVSCIETVNCTAERASVCTGSTVSSGTTKAGTCGTVDCSGQQGTRYCDMNWKEVAPGQ